MAQEQEVFRHAGVGVELDCGDALVVDHIGRGRAVRRVEAEEPKLVVGELRDVESLVDFPVRRADVIE